MMHIFIFTLLFEKAFNILKAVSNAYEVSGLWILIQETNDYSLDVTLIYQSVISNESVVQDFTFNL